jgi:serine/threonine-protein kinase
MPEPATKGRIGGRVRYGSVDAMNAGAGTLFGRYRLLRPIASDAVSTTYFATADGGGTRRSRSVTDHFAVRIADPVDPRDEHAVEIVRQYLAQTQEAGIIDHPTVVRPLDLGIIDGRPYVATAFVRAVPLGELLAHGGTINHSAALAMFAQLAGALDAAHRAGIVHGAISPRTVWVGPSAGEGVAYVAYLTGFGTSALLRWRMEDAPPGAPADDLLYVAPEQLRGEPATGRSDQYALACAVFHTLSGRPPFERETRAKLYGAHLLAPPPRLDSTIGAVAPDTSAALAIAMRKEPEERYATCGALIHEALPVEPSGFARSREPTPGVRSAPRTAPSRRLAWWRFAWAVLAFVAAMVALWAVIGADDRPAEDRATQPSSQVAAQAVAGSPPPTATATTHRILWDASVTTRPIIRVDALDQAVLVAARDAVAVLDTVDGTVRWHRDLDGATELATDGALVAYGGDALTAVAVDHGGVRWTTDGIGRMRSLTAAGARIVASAGGEAAQQIVAYDNDSGDELWRWDAGGVDSPHLIVAADGGVTYVLRGDVLAAIDLQGVSEPGSVEIDAPTWQVDVGAAWPVLTPTDGALVATEEGRVCYFTAADGTLRWCEAVPGVDAERPRLFTTAGLVVVATPTAVVALDELTGQQHWSVSPGSSDNQLAVGSSRIAIADGTGVRVVATDSGDPLLELTDLADVTAVGLGGGRMYVGSADGTLTAVGLGGR